MTPDTTPQPQPAAVDRPPLVIAGHGTRDAEGVAVCLALVERVRSLLPGVRVEAGFVELTPPTIDEALSSVLTNGVTSAVVVPLMIGSGGHVRDDIPEAIEIGVQAHPGAAVVYTRHLGSPAPLVAAARQRIDAACADWTPTEVTVVFVGRGCSVADANADHIRLGQLLLDAGGYAKVLPAFIQVAEPAISESLDVAHFTGSRRIVVMPHYLFPGRLTTWVQEAVDIWSANHLDTDVRVARPIGDCPELAEVVAKRYREGALKSRTNLGSPAYLTGLLLGGRKVVAVGGGRVNRRRVPKLLAVGAEVTVVSPDLHPDLAELAEAGRIAWRERVFLESDLDGAWYVLAATDDAEVNERVAAAAEARHTFCVRADQAELGSAWTPATGDLPGATFAVLASQNPRHAKALRNRLRELMEASDD
ncbi:MAG: CbiX/SirB N-terminal domain-containing protein [Propionicimonas sp.]